MSQLIRRQLWLKWKLMEKERRTEGWMEAGCWSPSSCVISLNVLAAAYSLHRTSAVKHLQTSLSGLDYHPSLSIPLLLHVQYPRFPSPPAPSLQFIIPLLSSYLTSQRFLLCDNNIQCLFCIVKRRKRSNMQLYYESVPNYTVYSLSYRLK